MGGPNLQVLATADDGPRERDRLAAVEHDAAQLLARVVLARAGWQDQSLDEIALRGQVHLVGSGEWWGVVGMVGVGSGRSGRGAVVGVGGEW